MRSAAYLAAGITLALAMAAASDAPRRLTELLSPDEFKAAGLQKLTAQELAALEASLHRLAKPGSPTPKPAASVPARNDALFGAEMLSSLRSFGAPEAVRTRIAGPFTGWSGKTIFPLQNGQRWQQRLPGDFVAPRPLDNPEVVLERGPFGYRLLIVDLQHHVPVKRIE